MSLDFQSIREQVTQLGETAITRQQDLRDKQEIALDLLEREAQNITGLRQKVEDVVRNYDPSVRCALPVEEHLTASFPVPDIPEKISILAADGSQISPDRSAEVNYALINVGAIQMVRGSSEPPTTHTTSQLLYDDQLYTPSGTITEARLALMRDLHERAILAELAESAAPPVVTFTDGPMELWGGISGDSWEIAEFSKSLEQYLKALSNLHGQGVATAGYVDRPAANLVIRLLEVISAAQTQLAEIKKYRPLRGVTDIAVYRKILEAGARSAVFALQSQSAKSYQGPLALHFFYLNVGRPGHPYLARVEIPAWVAGDKEMLDNLHGSLVDQSRVMGARPYPYLLHRAHETAVVKLQEKEQVTQMISLELRKQGMMVDQVSAKQHHKQSQGRTRYEG